MESEIIRKAKIESYLSDHFLSQDVGNNLQACSIASMNIALGNGAVEDTPESVSPIITNWLMLTQDILSWDCRNNKLRLLLPELIGTGNNKQREIERLRSLKYWVFNRLIKNVGVIGADLGNSYKEALRLKSKKSFDILLKEFRENNNQKFYFLGKETDQYLEMLKFIATDKDPIQVARKIGMIAQYNNNQEWFDKEVIKLLKRLIK